METQRITVPARRKNTFGSIDSRNARERNVGQRYGGISRTKALCSLFRTEDLSILRREECRQKSENVKSEKRNRLRAEQTAQDRFDPARNAAIKQRVNGQPRRTRHERRDQNRRDAIALAFDRAGRRIAGTAHA